MMSTTSGFRSSFISASCAALLLAGSTSAQLAQSVTFSDTPLNLIALTSNEPGEIVNCFQVYFADAGFYAVVPDKPANGLEFTDRMRALAKYLAKQVVLTPGNYANAQYASGVLYGVEYDWFFPDDPNQPTRPNLDNPMSVYLTPMGGGSAELLSKIYAYDQSAYALRKAAIEAVIGHPMTTYVIWIGHSLSSTGSGPSGGITISGGMNQMAGSIAAGSDVAFSGLSNEVSGSVSSTQSVDLGLNNSAGSVLENSASPQAGSLFGPAYLRSLAISSGTYSQGSLTLTSANLGAPGLVFAEGDLTINVAALQGAWTFVSATGNLSFAGDGLQIQPALGSLLAIAYLGDIDFGASNALVVGEAHAPGGTLQLTGSGNTLLGSHSASQVKVSGSANMLSDGTVQAQ